MIWHLLSFPFHLSEYVCQPNMTTHLSLNFPELSCLYGFHILSTYQRYKSYPFLKCHIKPKTFQSSTDYIFFASTALHTSMETHLLCAIVIFIYLMFLLGTNFLEDRKFSVLTISTHGFQNTPPQICFFGIWIILS